MTKLEKLYNIIENSREVGVKLNKDVLQQGVDECRFSVHRIHVRKVFPVFAITAITCAITINFIATY
jgi:hypothetical protein